ncbi:hypothetical protein AMK18_11465 [Streptomyces sp. CB01249]|nr:hypothetical protein AMK18_11465 [Streptomyces sp. CB01249]
MTATSADDGCCGRVVRVVVLGSEGVAEGVDGLALEAESDVGVDASGDADVGVAEEFLDDDEFDALFQEQRGGRVAETVKRMRRRPTLRRSVVKARVRLVRSTDLPCAVVNTCPLCCRSADSPGGAFGPDTYG